MSAIDIGSALVVGLVGSLHCAGMCGPLALALPPSRAYLAGRLAYNAGRIATYCAMGLVCGAIGKTFRLAGVQQWLSIALGVALLAGLFASRRLALWRPVQLLVDSLKRPMSKLLKGHGIGALALLGLLNGLLPCGLVYVAAAGATATGCWYEGALYMGAFGLGTVPMMLAISLSGRLVPVSWRLRLLRAVPVAVFLLAALLVLRGMNLGIPFISPALASDTPSCCHP